MQSHTYIDKCLLTVCIILNDRPNKYNFYNTVFPYHGKRYTSETETVVHANYVLNVGVIFFLVISNCGEKG